MKRKVVILSSALEALIVLAVIYFEPTYQVRGILWSEATFEGKPTSYWRDELERWEVSNEPGIHWMGHRGPWFQRNDTRFERFRDRLRPREKTPDDHEVMMLLLMDQVEARQFGPSLLRRNDEAKSVLQELLNDSSPKIRLFAQIGLGMKPKIPGDD